MQAGWWGTNPHPQIHCKSMVSRIIQGNLQKSLLATECLIKDVWTRAKPTIVLIQEPYTGRGGRPKGVPSSFECHFGGDNPRTAIVAYKSNLLLCPSYSGRDVTTCQVSLDLALNCNLNFPTKAIIFLPKDCCKQPRRVPACIYIKQRSTSSHNFAWL